MDQMDKLDHREHVVILVSVDVSVIQDVWDLLVLLDCRENLDQKVLKVTLVILVHRAHLEDLVLRVLRDQLGRKASEVKWVLEALQEVWALLALQVILAQLEQLASVDLLANQEPPVQWAQLDPKGK